MLQGRTQAWLEKLNAGLDLQTLEIANPDCLSQLKSCAQQGTPVILKVRFQSIQSLASLWVGHWQFMRVGTCREALNAALLTNTLSVALVGHLGLTDGTW